MIYTIKTMLNKGISQRNIALQLGINRKTVKKYCQQIIEGKVEEPQLIKAKSLDLYKDKINQWYEKGLTARLIFDRLKSDLSIDISYPSVARYIKDLKASEVFIPLICKPAEEAQVDYGYMGRFIKDDKEVKVWCFVMTLSYSRLQYVEMVTNQSILSFLQSHQNAFEYFSGVPQTVKIDNLKAGVILPSFYEPQIQTQYAEFLDYYSSAPITARVRRPQDKGKVEAGVKYVENNFLKNLEHKDFYCLQKDIKQWLEKANRRVHGTTKKVPLEQFNITEKQQLNKLPDTRFELYNISRRKVNNYAHITFENNYYSVPAAYVSKEVIIKYTEKILRIYDKQNQISIHTISNEQGNFITQENHKPLEKQSKNKDYYLDKASKIGAKAKEFSVAVTDKKPFEYQRIINGLCDLARKHGNVAVDKACERSLKFNALKYSCIKNICEKEKYSQSRETLAVINSGGFNHDLTIYDNLN